MTDTTLEPAAKSLPPKARTAIEEATRLDDWSASRLGVAGKCGLAFEYQYVHKIPAPFDRAATILGSVVHDGAEVWYGPEGSTQHQELDLAPIVLAQWEQYLPPIVWSEIQRLRDIDAECSAVAAAILFKRPELKSPTMTKAYLESEVVKDFNDRHGRLLEVCESLEEISWPKDEGPYKQYKLTAQMADQMQKRWQKLPRPLAVEWPFAIEFDGFRLRGRIDQLRLDPNPRTGEAIPRLRDIKTGRQEMTQMEAFLQAFIYAKAIQLSDFPTTERVDFYLTRKDKYQDGRIDLARHERLASRILNGRSKAVAEGQFEPAYGMWCKLCDFRPLCESEISLWEGDGIVAEVQ